MGGKKIYFHYGFTVIYFIIGSTIVTLLCFVILLYVAIDFKRIRIRYIVRDVFNYCKMYKFVLKDRFKNGIKLYTVLKAGV